MDHHLALRQQLKETFRAKLRKESGNKTTTSVSTDNYGNFFGPSEVVFTGRVVEESKSWLQNPKLVKIQQTSNEESHNGSRTLIKTVKKYEKIQKIKESRDYSYLFSDHPDHRSDTKSSVHHPEEDEEEEEEEKTVVVPPVKLIPVIKLKIKNKGQELKNPTTTGADQISTSTTKVPTAISKPVVVEKSIIGSTTTKSPDLKKKPLIMGQQKKRKIEEKVLVKQHAKKKKQLQRGRESEIHNEDEINAIDIIRRMFRYDPSKFGDDRDDPSMEASFADIQREERRSAKIASKEDAEELKRIEQLQHKRNSNAKKIRV